MREATSRGRLLVCVRGGMEALPLCSPGGVAGRASGRDRPWATVQLLLGNGQVNASVAPMGEGDLTVGCVWQSAYPPDAQFADPRVHRFSPRHRKPARLGRMARAAPPMMLR